MHGSGNHKLPEWHSPALCLVGRPGLDPAYESRVVKVVVATGCGRLLQVFAPWLAARASPTCLQVLGMVDEGGPGSPSHGTPSSGGGKGLTFQQWSTSLAAIAVALSPQEPLEQALVILVRYPSVAPTNSNSINPSINQSVDQPSSICSGAQKGSISCWLLDSPPSPSPWPFHTCNASSHCGSLPSLIIPAMPAATVAPSPPSSYLQCQHPLWLPP